MSQESKACEKIQYALAALDIESEIVYTGGGFYVVLVSLTDDLLIQASEGGAEIINADDHSSVLLISVTTTPWELAHEIANIYKINK
jgi:hypothetical protein